MSWEIKHIDVNKRVDILIREKLCITQRQFAKDIGIGESNVSHIIHGERPVGVDIVIRICEVYGVDANWLLGFTCGEDGEV